MASAGTQKLGRGLEGAADCQHLVLARQIRSRMAVDMARPLQNQIPIVERALSFLK